MAGHKPCSIAFNEMFIDVSDSSKLEPDCVGSPAIINGGLCDMFAESRLWKTSLDKVMIADVELHHGFLTCLLCCRPAAVAIQELAQLHSQQPAAA